MNLRMLRVLAADLLMITLVACGGARDRTSVPDSGAAAGDISRVASPSATLDRPAPTTTEASGLPTPPAIATPGALPVAPVVQPTLPGIESQALVGAPFTVPVPDGWAVRETAEGFILLEDAASLAAAELECPALLARRVPGATKAGDVLAAYDLSRALRQKEIPLVIAGHPVEAIDATFSSPITGRVYQVVLVPLVIEGEGWLLMASMPEGQARNAWPTLATMLGSVALRDG
ncbi:MAG: hypothetical protein ACYCYF_04500 [Anaerolineae bacterium]